MPYGRQVGIFANRRTGYRQTGVSADRQTRGHFLTCKASLATSKNKIMISPGNPYCTGRISTVDLLVLTCPYQPHKKLNIVFFSLTKQAILTRRYIPLPDFVIPNFYLQVPLTFDRASETKVGVFYTRLKTLRCKS